jgi:beta-lactamase class D
MNPAAVLLSCVVVFNGGTGETTRVGDRCETRLSPASTFKIPHALVALETGVVTAATVEKWDGTKHPAQPLWDRDHTVLSAMRPSVLWFFQRIAPRVGAERMRGWLQQFDYGNAESSGPITQYWVNGTLRVSPEEQVRFLRRFYAGDLPVSAGHIAAVRGSLEQQPGTVQNARGVHRLDAVWPAGAALNSKTGASTIANGESVSWLVGRLAVDGNYYVFAGAVWRARGGVDTLDGARAAVRAFKTQRVLR